MMRLRTLILAAAVSIAPIGVRAQSPRLDQTEILGRLAVGYSPSYIAHLVKMRGVTFSPTADFMYRVRLAGGEGILVERLSSNDAAPSVISSADQDVPVRHLAKCGELMHTGAVETAEKECRAAIEENPKSPWPLLAVATLIKPDVFSGTTFASPETSVAERMELLKRAAALAPNLSIAHRELAYVPGVPEAGAEMQKAAALDPYQMEISQVAGLTRAEEMFGDIGSVAQSGNFTVTDAEITLPPNLAQMRKVEPDLASNHVAVGTLYWRVGNVEKARQEFREAVRLEPSAAMPRLVTAMMDITIRDNEAALAELHEMVRIAPAGIAQHVALAAVLDLMGRNSEAMDDLRSTIAMHPGAAEPSEAFVDLSLRHKDLKAAIGEIQRSLDVVSSAYTDQSKFVEAYEGKIDQLLKLLFEDHQLEAAAQEYQSLLRYRPDDAGLHNDYGIVLMNLHRLDEAMAQYNEAVRLDPQMPSAHHNIGLCLAAKANLDGAVQEFRQALELNPNEPNTQVLLGATLAQQGDAAGAREQVQQALAKNPEDADTHLGAAMAYERLKDTPAAIQEFKKTLELNPDSAPAENDLAWIYATADDEKLRDSAQALVLARQAVANSPEPNSAFLDTLAEALLINGQAAEALKYELQAVKIDPQNEELQTRLLRFQAAVKPQVAAKQ
jgi:Tfp pilus assembly protein PilF